jgi:plasmid stabilization system protein ParE
MLIVQPEAERDIIEARRWYEARQTGVGDEFLVEIDRVLGLIERNPTGYAILRRQTRKVSLRRFPYIVLYTARGSDIFVVGIIHQSRDPKVMRARIV